MKKLCVLLVLSFNVLILFSQKNSKDRDDVFAMERYEKDPDAEALIVYDIGETSFIDSDEGGFVLQFKRRCRIKVLSAAGLQYAEVKIPLYTNGTDMELLNDFNSVTYHSENAMINQTHGNKKEMFEEIINKNWVQKKMAIPGVKVGSVFDFSYTITSPFLFNIQDWEFQHEIPVIYSEYTTRMIPFYSYIFLAIGLKKFDEFEANEAKGNERSFMGVKYRDMVYRFAMNDVAAFRDVDFISAPSDYKLKIDFQLDQINRLDGSKEKVMTTWPALISAMNKNQGFGKYIKACKGESKNVLAQVPLQEAKQLEVLEKLVQHVKWNYVWNGRKSQYIEESPRSFMKKKSGNVANINLFLVALLREAGIQADPVIISTRDHGKIYSDYPFAHFFNYVVVASEIDGKVYLSDATEQQTQFNQLPERCLNDKGLIVRKGEEQWVILSPQENSLEANKFNFKLSTLSDSVDCTYTYMAMGYDCIRQKIKHQENPDGYLQEMLGSSFDKIIKSRVKASDSVQTFNYTVSGIFLPNRIEKVISLQPFLKVPIHTNPFNKKERNYPVDLVYQRKYSYETIFEIAENMKIIKMPENVLVNNENFFLQYTTLVEGNRVLVKAEYRLKKFLYEPEKYQELKKFTDRVIKTLNQDIQISL